MLRAGARVLYWDDDMNGHASLWGPVTVVRARGLGVLVARAGGHFRIDRGIVGKVVVTCPACAGLGATNDGRPAHQAFGESCSKCDGEGWIAEEFRR